MRVSGFLLLFVLAACSSSKVPKPAEPTLIGTHWRYGPEKQENPDFHFAVSYTMDLEFQLNEMTVSNSCHYEGELKGPPLKAEVSGPVTYNWEKHTIDVMKDASREVSTEESLTPSAEKPKKKPGDKPTYTVTTTLKSRRNCKATLKKGVSPYRLEDNGETLVLSDSGGKETRFRRVQD